MVVVMEEEEERENTRVSTTRENTTTSSYDEEDDGYETASDTDLKENEIFKKEKEDSKEAISHTLQLSIHQKALEEANEAKLEGNKLFGNGQYEAALSKYGSALQVAPDIPSSAELRSICHSNCAICFLKMSKYEDAVKECTKALELNPSYLKALLRRAEAHEKLDHYEEAIADLKKILELDESQVHARRTIHRLEPLAAEKREKMKEEMIGKLKEMGNSVLGRFGMSVDNFKAVKDPNTGSYSISFQK